MKRIKELRVKTGLSVNECKKIVETTSNDDEAYALALKKLQELGLKKVDRDTPESTIHCAYTIKGLYYAVVKCETDFVARNKDFQAFCEKVKDNFVNNINSDALIQQNIGIFGEKIVIESEKIIPGYSYYYIHNKYTNNFGKFATYVTLKNPDENIGDIIAKQIACFEPQTIEDLKETKLIIDGSKTVQDLLQDNEIINFQIIL